MVIRRPKTKFVAHWDKEFKNQKPGMSWINRDGSNQYVSRTVTVRTAINTVHNFMPITKFTK